MKINKIKAYEDACARIRMLNLQGCSIGSQEIYVQYQMRNSLGLMRDTKIHRIFQETFYVADQINQCLTLPRADSSVWKDPLENPLRDVQDVDSSTGEITHFQSLFNFHALCWTRRSNVTKEDWDGFSHDANSVRISTTAGKLLDRLMDISDPSYMHRFWLLGVEYMDKENIEEKRSAQEVYSRLESTGLKLASSAAIVRKDFSSEDEVRLLFDGSITPKLNDINYVDIEGISCVRIPFDWDGFVDNVEFNTK